MRHLLSISVVVVASLGFAGGAQADADTASHYYVSLGDSLAAGTNATEVGVAYTDLGYADQVYGALAANDPKLELVKLGCPGESTVSMRFGSQLPTVVGSCGTPDYYKHVLYPKGSQLAEAVSFLKAHKDKVALVTIDLGANDISHDDGQGDTVSCVVPPEDCDAESASIAANLGAILDDLRAAAGPAVPIVGMTYYDAYAPLCSSVEDLVIVCSRIDQLNALLARTYAAAGVPVADVAGAFENGSLPNAAANVCTWTWVCLAGDFHPNVSGYQVIADAFLDVLQP